MRRLLWIVFSCFSLSYLGILASLHLPVEQRCQSLVSVLRETPSTIESLILDTNTGVWLDYDIVMTLPYLVSPNKRYRYDVDGTDVIITDFETDEQMVLFSGENIRNLVWSDDSQSLIIWHFQRDTNITTATSYYIDSGDVRFEYRNPPGVRWQRQDFWNTSYLYAQTALDGTDTLSHAVMFMDTNTGEITNFQNPTRFPFSWSHGGRWVANEHWYGINIIDPEIGDFHPNFTEPFIGHLAQWQGDTTLWFVRDNEALEPSIWRTHLADGMLIEVLSNARLETISPDGQWVYGYNALDDDMALMHVSTNERINLNVERLQRVHTDVVFSPNGSCAAIFTSHNDNTHHLRVMDLKTRRMHHYQSISGAFNDVNWVNLKDLD